MNFKITRIYLLLFMFVVSNITGISANTNYNSAVADEVIPILDDTLGIGFSQASGFFDTNFNLTITANDTSARLIVTLDGSNPQNYSISSSTESPAVIQINPESTSNRPATPAVIVRVSLVKAGFSPTVAVTRTFIFPAQVKLQSAPGQGWPDSSINNQSIKLPISAQIAGKYGNAFGNYLKNVPSLSIITDLDNLFDPATGIYVNTQGYGKAWERFCSAELIYPDATTGFSINAGLQIKGDGSWKGYKPKHPFRLVFDSEYGDSVLNFPLFGDDGTSVFHAIDLRCEENYAWSDGDSRNSMVREVFSRDSQRDMDQLYTHSSYYHLYLNGMYWGLYQSQEIPDANFAKEYLGGTTSDYDIVYPVFNGFEHNLTPINGSTDNWNMIYQLSENGFESNADYYELEGKNVDGLPVRNSQILVDIDNLMDYMLTIFYTGNFDSPVSSFSNNKEPSNFYAVYNKIDKSLGWNFLVDNAVHSLFYDSADPGIGLMENRMNLATLSKKTKMEVNDFSGFNPQWLHYKLCENEEYRQRFTDRAYLRFANSGIFTPEVATARLNKRVAEIVDAVVPESARWGEYSDDDPETNNLIFTKEANWLPLINRLRNDFFPDRTALLFDQLFKVDIYPPLNPPQVRSSGTPIYNTVYNSKATLNLNFLNQNNLGVIYYTTNNTDPRLTGGEISPDAIEIESGKEIKISKSAVIRARVYHNHVWSALRIFDVVAKETNFSNLKITEINYHPKNQNEDGNTLTSEQLQFIEFKNIGTTSINLSGVTVNEAIDYTFPANTLLAPGNFYVISANPSMFYDWHGLLSKAKFTGILPFSDSRIVVKSVEGNVIMDFTYGVSGGWPEEANGEGASLVPVDVNPKGNPDTVTYWKASVHAHGSPFHDDGVYTDINEISGSDINKTYTKVYPNPINEGVVTIAIYNNEQQERFKVKLIDLNGQLIYETEIFEKQEIDINSLGIKQGIYFLRVESDSKIENHRVVIIH